jgi:hypothetical protein
VDVALPALGSILAVIGWLVFIITLDAYVLVMGIVWTVVTINMLIASRRFKENKLAMDKYYAELAWAKREPMPHLLTQKEYIIREWNTKLKPWMVQHGYWK